MAPLTGRTDEALQCLREAEELKRPEFMRHFIGLLRLLLEHQHTESKSSTEFCIRHFTDPEADLSHGAAPGAAWRARPRARRAERCRGLRLPSVERADQPSLASTAPRMARLRLTLTAHASS